MTSTPRSRRASAGLLRLGLVASALTLLAALPVVAKQDDRNKPMNVEKADSFDGYQKPNSVTTLKGDVVITQGTLRLTGDVVKVHLDANSDISRTVLTGSPAHVQQLDDSGNLMQGEASTIDYDNIKGVAVLTGNAVVKQQGRGEAHGDKLTYDTQTSQMTGDSNGDGRVHMVFLPKPKPAGAAPATTPGTTAPAPAVAASVPAPASSTPAPATSARQP